MPKIPTKIDESYAVLGDGITEVFVAASVLLGALFALALALVALSLPVLLIIALVRFVF